MTDLQKTQFIKDIAPGDEIDTLFLLAQAVQAQARNGPFWRLELKDRTGTLEAKIWSPLSQNIPALQPGSLVRACGRVSLYRDRLDLNVEAFQVICVDDWSGVDAALFLPAAKQRPEAMWRELEALCGRTMRHPPWRKFIRLLLDDPFISEHLKTAPAAKGVHHAYCGGLLEHTLGVAGLCMKLADSYPQLDRQLLLAGAVCHDLGKLWELCGGPAPDYTDPGRLLGHIELGLEAVSPYLHQAGLEPELCLHLKHLIISHHGELEFGSPKRPKTAEAFALHFADNIDARMAQLREVLGAMPPAGAGGSNWSPFQATLSRFLYRAMPTPQQPDEGAAGEAAAEPEALTDAGELTDAGAGRIDEGVIADPRKFADELRQAEPGLMRATSSGARPGGVKSRSERAGGGSSRQGSLLGAFRSAPRRAGGGSAAGTDEADRAAGAHGAAGQSRAASGDVSLELLGARGFYPGDLFETEPVEPPPSPGAGLSGKAAADRGATTAADPADEATANAPSPPKEEA